MLAFFSLVLCKYWKQWSWNLIQADGIAVQIVVRKKGLESCLIIPIHLPEAKWHNFSWIIFITFFTREFLCINAGCYGYQKTALLPMDCNKRRMTVLPLTEDCDWVFCVIWGAGIHKVWFDLVAMKAFVKTKWKHTFLCNSLNRRIIKSHVNILNILGF